MDGKALFDKYIKLRDFSGSADDEYAQLLTTIFMHIRDGIYPLLETAEKGDKRLSIRQGRFEGEVLVDEILASDIILIQAQSL